MRLNIRWSIIVVVFFTALVFFWGIKQWQQQQFVDEPLINALYEYDEVKEVKLGEENNVLLIVVKLDYVDNLAETTVKLENSIRTVLGKRPFNFAVKDNRNEYLENIYEEVHLAFYEGERRGNYQEMGDNIKKSLNNYDVDDYNLLVDYNRIYFQVKQGNNYLYEIINIRSPEEKDEAFQ